MEKTLIISDLHIPFHDSNSLQKVVSVSKDEKPNTLIINGDMYDMYNFSKHAKTQNEIMPIDEIACAQAIAIDLIESIRKATPKTKILYLLGNHEMRPFKKIMHLAPELEGLLDKGMFEFKGVKTLYGSRARVDLRDFTVLHGVSTKQGYHMDRLNRSVVFGHTHRAHIIYKKRDNGLIWEMNTGCLCDESETAFGYMPFKETGWVQSVGIVIQGATESRPLLITL